MKKQINKEIIPIFFSSDDNYIPYLSVAIRSLIDNASKKYNYVIYVLNNGLKQENIDAILKLQKKAFKIELINVTEKIQPIIEKLGLRDYYTAAIYFRLFIASLFKQYSKVLYLDCDIVVLGDISELYNTQLDNNILGAVTDQIVFRTKAYRTYADKALGITDPAHYFNSGILVMNLDAFRSNDIENKFVEILTKHNFNTIAPDQDYLNFLCKGKVKYLDLGWNKECLRDGYNKKPNIVHYAFFKKPWTDYYIKFEKYFWQYAKKVSFYNFINEYRKNFKITKRINNVVAQNNLIKRAKSIYNSDHNFYKVLEEPFIEKNTNLSFATTEDVENEITFVTNAKTI